MGTPWLSCSSLPSATSTRSTGSARSPAPAECAAVLPGSTHNTPGPDTSIYVRRSTDTGRGGSASRHGQLPAQAAAPCVLPGRGWLGPVPSRHQATSLALGEGRVTLQTLFFQKSGTATCPWLRGQSRDRWGDLLVASCPGSHQGQEPVPAAEAQSGQVSIPVLVVLTLQGERGEQG